MLKSSSFSYLFCFLVVHGLAQAEESQVPRVGASTSKQVTNKANGNHEAEITIPDAGDYLRAKQKRTEIDPKKDDRANFLYNPDKVKLEPYEERMLISLNKLRHKYGKGLLKPTERAMTAVRDATSLPIPDSQALAHVISAKAGEERVGSTGSVGFANFVADLNWPEAIDRDQNRFDLNRESLRILLMDGPNAVGISGFKIAEGRFNVGMTLDYVPQPKPKGGASANASIEVEISPGHSSFKAGIKP